LVGLRESTASKIIFYSSEEYLYFVSLVSMMIWLSKKLSNKFLDFA
jgi:hypothetical protein